MFIDKTQFDELTAGQAYWKGRWEYISIAIEIARKYAPRTVLEIGANHVPLACGCDVLDIREGPRITYVQDAADSWRDVANYDLVIALQVFEHFQGRQKQVFQEMRQHARHAVVSIPYLWKYSKAMPDHDGLSDATLKDWFGLEPEYRQVVGNDPFKRLIWGFSWQ